MILKDYLNDLIKRSLEEDLGTGDITTSTTIPEDKIISGKFIAKEMGIICGVEVVKAVFKYVDNTIKLTFNKHDGDSVDKLDIIGTINGNARNILMGERIALNLFQRMSGIATRTLFYVNQTNGYQTKIVDTRKTTPGLRVLEKYAVTKGGGFNHRFNLADGIMIKDNHIKAAGSIKKAVQMARENSPHTIKIEVETETLHQVKEALDAKADIIMLDNMDDDTMKKAVEIIGDKALTEASGNMDVRDIEKVCKTGVDFISIGALTHSVKSLDISLKFENF